MQLLEEKGETSASVSLDGNPLGWQSLLTIISYQHPLDAT